MFDLRDIIHSTLISTINKHLSFYSTNVFKFVEFIIVLIPSEIENIIPNFKEAIIKVEGMRGVGYDNTLRYIFILFSFRNHNRCYYFRKGLQRIQEIINQQSK